MYGKRFVTGAINMPRRAKCITCIRNKVGRSVGRSVGADWICHRSRNNLSARTSSSGRLTKRYTAMGEVCYGAVHVVCHNKISKYIGVGSNIYRPRDTSRARVCNVDLSLFPGKIFLQRDGGWNRFGSNSLHDKLGI